MNKDNIFRSSQFHMDRGDKLTMIIIDETGTTIDISLLGGNPFNDNQEGDVPDMPLLLSITNITATTFQVNWNLQENITGFRIDVGKDSLFSSMVTGFNNLDAGNVDHVHVTGLVGTYTYYVRIRGYNSNGTGVSSASLSATTLTETITDQDGNVYTYVTIGTQQWLVENFRSTKYKDNSAIANITNDALWAADVTGAYCWYNNDIANKPLYGALYNHFAVRNAKGLGITGWRVPTYADNLALRAFLGGAALAGGPLKEETTDYWLAPNTGATNATGFTALPGGLRLQLSAFSLINETGVFWASDWDSFPDSPYNMRMDYDSAALSLGISLSHPEFGESVRLMRDV